MFELVLKITLKKKRNRQVAVDLAASLFTHLKQEAAYTCFKIRLESYWHSAVMSQKSPFVSESAPATV